jgi:DNA helicase-4
MPDISVSTLYRLLSFKWNYSVEISAECIQKNASGNEQKLPFSKISQLPEIRYGFLWDKIVLISSDLVPFTISGIKKRESKNSLTKISQHIEGFYLKQIRPAYEQISGSIQSFESIFNNRYGRHSDVERWKKQNAVLSEKLNNNFALSFISKQEQEDVSRFLNLFTSCHEVRESENQKFVAGEINKYQDFFDKVENNPLTSSQRLACVVNEDNNLVLAGAGSGKTSVIIAKAGYLIQSGLAQPYEILILAYGRKASKETDERIKEKLPDIEGVTSSTFHKLGLDIIGQATGIKPRVSKFQEDTAEFYKLINNIITDLTKSDKAYNQRVIDYLVTHLIPYKDQLEYDQQGDYFSALKECNLQSIKSKIEWAEKRSGRKTLQHEQLKSFEEVVIADFLFVNGIKYIYEHPYEIQTATATNSQYHPDFYLPDYGIYIEHFGISKNKKTAPFIDQMSYLKGMKWKRDLHREYKTKLVETFSYEMKEGTLTDLLYSKLEVHGVKFAPLSFPELIQILVDAGAEQQATEFTKLIVTFLDLFKQSGHTFDTIRLKADKHKDKPRCHAFLDVFELIYEKYNTELERSGTVDFSDMIRKATDLVNNGKYKPRFRYILVDEFQDISAIRADLVKSLVGHGTETVLSCVGDDWQSIYRFSGSDVNYTGNFENYFGFTKRVPLEKTFRFNDKINDFATTFVTQNPAQIKKNITSHTSVSTNSITLVEYYQDIDMAIQNCVDDIKNNYKDDASIYILGRYKFSKPDFLNKTGKNYPSFKFFFDTVHGSKGKEADFVIVAEVNDAKFGFPSKIVEEPLFELVLPEPEPHEYAEERRLFYVAITRSKHHSYILYDAAKPSVFIKEIIDKEGSKYWFNRISTAGVKAFPPDYGICPSCKTGKITMRVMPDGRFFFGCQHYPYCNYTPRICNQCNKFPMIKKENYYYCQNPECKNISKACQLCDGMMVERVGRLGRFLGCSNYAKKKCGYTEQIFNNLEN